MLVRISGAIKDYAWGSRNLIQDHFGLGEQNQRVAEVWFGTHPGGESKLVSSDESLSQHLGSKLSFLVKFLAAESPLSIQVHPNTTQAQLGFAREQSLGLEISDPRRNYKDQSHKPELLVALTSFSALCGFRPRAEMIEVFSAFSSFEPKLAEFAKQLSSGSPLEEVFTKLLNSPDVAKSLEDNLSGQKLDGELASKALELTKYLFERYPADTGVLVSLMLNHVELSKGEAIFLPAGNLHAYLKGLGLEVMASSDNVIRGGLTQKHVDHSELVRVADFTELDNPKSPIKKLAEGLSEYQVSTSDFKVYRAEVSGANLLADIDLPGQAIVVCDAGEIAIGTSLEQREVLKKGDVAYLAQAKKFSLSGSGSCFVILGS